MKRIKRNGILIVISSPSGTGKTTICKKLIENDQNLYLSISVTTRKKRNKEVEGIDYFFKSKNDFLKLKSENLFIENATVFSNYYGTLKNQVTQKLENGVDVIIDIDWQGTRQINSYMKGNLVKVFLLPPSLADLSSRLSSRGTDSLEEIDYRMSKAIKEIKHYDEYDYVLINSDIEDVYKKIRKIIESERMKLIHQIGIKEFVGDLTKK